MFAKLLSFGEGVRVVLSFPCAAQRKNFYEVFLFDVYILES